MQPTIEQILVGFIKNLRYFFPIYPNFFNNLEEFPNSHYIFSKMATFSEISTIFKTFLKYILMITLSLPSSRATSLRHIPNVNHLIFTLFFLSHRIEWRHFTFIFHFVERLGRKFHVRNSHALCF